MIRCAACNARLRGLVSLYGLSHAPACTAGTIPDRRSTVREAANLLRALRRELLAR